MADLTKQAQVRKAKTEKFLNEFKGMTEEKAKAHIKDTYINTQIVYELICAYVYYFDKSNSQWIKEYYEVEQPRRKKVLVYQKDGKTPLMNYKTGKQSYELVETNQTIKANSISNLRKEFIRRYNIEVKEGSFRTNQGKDSYDPFSELFS